MQLDIVQLWPNPDLPYGIAQIMIKDADLLPKIRIAHNVSQRGIGISLHDAIQQTDYANLRLKIDVAHIARLLREHPGYIEDWVLYSLDKRTKGGWYLLEKSNEIGALNISCSRRRFQSLEDAVANFILKELESHVGRAQKPD